MNYTDITLSVGCHLDQEIVSDLLDFLGKDSAGSRLVLCVQTGSGFCYNQEPRDLPCRASEKPGASCFHYSSYHMGAITNMSCTVRVIPSVLMIR